MPLRIETKLLARALPHVPRTIAKTLDIPELNPDQNRKQENVAQTKLYLDLTDLSEGMSRKTYE